MNLHVEEKTKTTSAEFYKRIESKVADFDVRGAIKLLCSNDSFAPNNESTINELKEKHPSPSRPFLPPPPAEDEHFQVMPYDVQNSTLSFASGSASGMDGFRP